MKANKFERQNRYVERLKSEGLKRYQFWMKPEEKEYVMKILENFREGIIFESSEKPSKHNIPSDSQNSRINRLIKEGHFSNLPRKPSPPYFHDLLNAPDRFWDMPLPDAMIVVADSHLRVKQWRAVSLKGLGAFPVVWTIITTMNRHVFQEVAKVAPRRRTFNLFEHDFETIVERIVGRAAMRADDNLKGTPLGFLTYPVEVSSFLVDSTIIVNPPEKILTVIVDANGRLKRTNAICDDIEQITNWRITTPALNANVDTRKGWNPYMLALSEIFK